MTFFNDREFDKIYQKHVSNLPTTNTEKAYMRLKKKRAVS